MIGGTDIIIPTARGSDALDHAIRAVTQLWPHALFEDGETGKTFRHCSEIALAGRREILAFRDEKSASLWDKLGADPSLDGTLIHFLLSDTDLTVVVDGAPPPEIRSFVGKLRRDLTKDVVASGRKTTHT